MHYLRSVSFTSHRTQMKYVIKKGPEVSYQLKSLDEYDNLLFNYLFVISYSY